MKVPIEGLEPAGPPWKTCGDRLVVLCQLHCEKETAVNPPNNLAYYFSCDINLNNVDLLKTIGHDFCHSLNSATPAPQLTAVSSNRVWCRWCACLFWIAPALIATSISWRPFPLLSPTKILKATQIVRTHKWPSKSFGRPWVWRRPVGGVSKQCYEGPRASLDFTR
jgi:hypothetical protein